MYVGLVVCVTGVAGGTAAAVGLCGVGGALHVGSLQTVTPLVQQVQPCLNPLQHVQSLHSGNQNSAACDDNTPF